jgi:uridine phosphorylase
MRKNEWKILFISMIFVFACAHQRSPSSQTHLDTEWQQIAGGNIKAKTAFYQQDQQYCADVVMQFTGLSTRYTKAINWSFEIKSGEIVSQVDKKRWPATSDQLNVMREAYGSFEQAELPVTFCQKTKFDQVIITPKELPYAKGSEFRFKSNF